MVTGDNQSESTPLAPESTPIPAEQAATPADSSGKTPFNLSEFKERYHKSIETVQNDAAKAAAKPFQPRDTKVWGVLTAVSNKARERKQGLKIVLNMNVHFFGRLVEDDQFRFDSKQVSGEHCKIYKHTFPSGDDALKSQPVFLKDNSSNGTYVNWKRLTRKDDAVRIHHGDIISFVGPFYTDIAYAFVYREAVKSAASSNRVNTKRKAEGLAYESKKVKETILGAPGCPISLDEFHSLQRTNMELRKQLKDQTVILNKLQEIHASLEHPQTEMVNSYLNVIKEFKEIQEMIDATPKELGEVYKLSDEQKHTMDDLNGRLAEINEMMSSSKEVHGLSSELRRLNIVNRASQGGVDDESGHEEGGSQDNQKNLKISGGNNDASTSMASKT